MNRLWADCGAGPGPCLDNPGGPGLASVAADVVELSAIPLLLAAGFCIWRLKTMGYVAVVVVAVVGFLYAVAAGVANADDLPWYDDVVICLAFINIAIAARRLYAGKRDTYAADSFLSR